MAKLTAMPDTDEILHAALVAVGVFVLSHLWMVELGQNPIGWTFDAIWPLFLFMTVGIVIWDRLVHMFVKH